MTKEEKTEIFIQYQYLIKKIAGQFWMKNRSIDYKELLSEGYLSFILSIDDYDSDFCTIGTFIQSCTKNHLINYVNLYYKKYPYVCTDQIDTFKTENNESNSPFLDLFETSDNKILQGIVEVLKNAKYEKALHHRKYGWLNKRVREVTGETYDKIHQHFKMAEQLIKQS